MPVHEVDAAWVAGLLEGEGCFSLKTTTNQSGKQYRYPAICCEMTDEDTILRLAEKVGVGTVFGPREPVPGNKPCWRWSVQAKDAASALMRELRPLMGARRQAKIDEILSETYGRVYK